MQESTRAEAEGVVALERIPADGLVGRPVGGGSDLEEPAAVALGPGGVGERVGQLRLASARRTDEQQVLAPGERGAGPLGDTRWQLQVAEVRLRVTRREIQPIREPAIRFLELGRMEKREGGKIAYRIPRDSPALVGGGVGGTSFSWRWRWRSPPPLWHGRHWPPPGHSEQVDMALAPSPSAGTGGGWRTHARGDIHLAGPAREYEAQGR
jgi:hypothetical protein